MVEQLRLRQRVLAHIEREQELCLRERYELHQQAKDHRHWWLCSLWCKGLQVETCRKKLFEDFAAWGALHTAIRTGNSQNTLAALERVLERFNSGTFRRSVTVLGAVMNGPYAMYLLRLAEEDYSNILR